MPTTGQGQACHAGHALLMRISDLQCLHEIGSLGVAIVAPHVLWCLGLSMFASAASRLSSRLSRDLSYQDDIMLRVKRRLVDGRGGHLPTSTTRPRMVAAVAYVSSWRATAEDYLGDGERSPAAQCFAVSWGMPARNFSDVTHWGNHARLSSHFTSVLRARLPITLRSSSYRIRRLKAPRVRARRPDPIRPPTCELCS
jgi:hypothetical protein